MNVAELIALKLAVVHMQMDVKMNLIPLIEILNLKKMSRKHKRYTEEEDQIILDELDKADNRAKGLFLAYKKLDGRNVSSVYSRFYRKLNKKEDDSTEN